MGDIKGKMLNRLTAIKKWGKKKRVGIITYIKSSKRNMVIIGSTVGLLFIASTTGFAYYQLNSVTLYHVYVDGKEIGAVNSPSIVENWISSEISKGKYKYGLEVKFNNEINYEKDRVYKGQYNNGQVISNLRQTTELRSNVVELIIDGKSVGYVKDETTANKIINNVKQSYMPQKKEQIITASSTEEENQEKIELKEVEIKENIKMENTEVNPNELISEFDLENLFKKGTLEEDVYIVKSGDTISEVALMHNLTTDELYQLNPTLKGEYINIGDEINVTKMKPLLTVQTNEEVIGIEEIAYQVVTEKDSSMYSGESKVAQQGEKGKKEVQYEVVKENGVIIQKTILAEEILSEPQDKIIKKGTKPRTTGSLRLPTAGGVLTSAYGPRWGTTHKGIDISGVRDRTIRAADGGKVIYSGWKGSYGNAVMIDHGNGIVTLYAHMSSTSVSNGQSVTKGQKIGVMGSTGNSTGVHLHFEVRVNGVQKNPLNYVSF